MNTQQSPSALEVIDISYRYVGDTKTRRGKVAILPPEYRWLLDTDILGTELTHEWKEFDKGIFHYVDVALGETFEDLSNPSNIHGFNVTAIHVPCAKRFQHLAQLGSTP